ncbi:alpha-1,3-mannosyl-glycoprotein 2-beta-N-acetylglucosaminyltransferase-like isoform X3 [Eriocheir sinensis]|uniref:alpha-1,3-mannosyl-glycoprotein 2-beta-N-acetylglucosaminyltransferase-like isoform X3 n=1 Tax=Eriocheir sinensis TaxID=95602 RepID=UPI0021C64F81|nr:alpha-1,3-mannosyl-glycoprotein 2-beta-N-acetylglucosaminyltransferase-like isoform X3 [Eriocheir sinensis]
MKLMCELSNVTKMRKKQILLLKIGVVVWVCVVYALFLHKPATTTSSQKPHDINGQLDKLEDELNKQSQFYNVLLNKLRTMQQQQQQQQQSVGGETGQQESLVGSLLYDGPVLPVLLIACNRDSAVRRSLDLLLKHRPSQERFPIIVSQDCGHRPTREVIESYGDKVTLIQHPDLTDIEVPLKERKFKGYFLIARHYRWALNQVFQKFEHEAVIIVEDDLDIAPDFYEYFSATYPILRADPTLWCVSAWNDNGKADLVDVKNGTGLLYRTDFFPGLGWMLTRELWEELGPKWPRSYWDDWVRAPEQRSGRACIRPEISRTRTFGKKGVSNGLFFEKHLKQIHLNAVYTSFTKMNLTYLIKDLYDPVFDKQVQDSQVVTINDVKGDRLAKGGSYRLIYHTKDNFKKFTKYLGLMDDFKAGIPRTGYKGTITFFYRGLRIFLSPGNNWKGYNPSWS